jgi:putative transposase
MKQYYPRVGLGQLCGLFGKTRQAYYDHSSQLSSRNMGKAIVLDMVQRTRQQLPKVGMIKLYNMLSEHIDNHGISMGRQRFCQLLRDNELQIKKRRTYARTTNSDHRFKKWPDLAAGAPPRATGELWVSDITYLTIKAGFIYLSVVTDAYSRKIVGYHLSQNLKSHSCIIALNKAISSIPNPVGLTHHSDRGIQYCCDEYVTRLQSSNIRISMTQSGSPYDNAIAERVNGILKNELGLNAVFENYSAAVGPTHKAIDLYNNIRPHMSCGYLTPAVAHQSNQELKKMWK